MCCRRLVKRFYQRKQGASPPYPSDFKCCALCKELCFCVLSKVSNAIFFRNSRFSLQHEKPMTPGASDVRLAPDSASESEYAPRGRARAHRLGLNLTRARARQYTHSEASSALGIVEGAEQREKSRQAQTPSRTEQRFAAHFCVAAGIRSFKTMLD